MNIIGYICTYQEHTNSAIDIIYFLVLIGENVKFIMNAANHNLNAITTYPFTDILQEEGGINRKHLSELPI